MKNLWHFFGLTQETIGRKRYFLANITLTVVLIAMYFIMTALTDGTTAISIPITILFLTLSVFGLAVYIKTSIRRVRDIGIARSWWILAIIPWVNILFFIFLCVKKGQASPK
jgi:uncharacterized membrane protein YhaH (DUF805 family)